MEIDFKAIGERIKDRRQEIGYTQEKIAEEMQVSTVYMSRIERGVTEISLKRLAQIAEILKISIEELITGIKLEKIECINKELNEILKECNSKQQIFIYQLAKMVQNLKM